MMKKTNLRQFQEVNDKICISCARLLCCGILLLLLNSCKVGVIKSNSMYPSLETGDMVLIKEVDARTLKIGDIIVYDYNSVDIIHRVIAIDYELDPVRIFTKGDNNSFIDPVVYENQVKGKVVFQVSNSYIVFILILIYLLSSVLFSLIIDKISKGVRIDKME